MSAPTVDRLEEPTEGPRSAARGWLVGAALVATVPAVAVLALTLGGAVQEPLPGLPDAGPLARWGLPVVRGLHDAAAAVTVGLLVLAALLLPATAGRPRDELHGLRLRAVRLAGGTAAGWAVAAAAVLVLTYADVVGSSPLDDGMLDQVGYFAQDFDLGRSYALVVVLALVVSIGAQSVSRTTSSGVLAVVALVALWPLALAGHASGADDHETAVTSVLVHLVAVTVWVGGLAGILLLHRPLGADLPAVVARFSRLAVWCFVLVAVSGVVSAVVRVDGPSDLLSPYGALLGAKVVALAGLGLVAARQRAAVVGGLRTAAAAPGRLLVRLTVVELAVMAVAVGLAVALSRTSPTDPLAAQEPRTLTESLLGYEMPAPLTVARWFTSFHLDLLWLTVAAGAATGYVAALRRLRRRGDRWPAGRTVAWLLGCLVLAWATNGGPGAYGKVLFSMHMVQHMTIAMAVPILLVLGAPVTLALRTLRPRRDGGRGPREWLLAAVHSRLLRVVAHPVVAPGVFVGSLVAFYYSPLFELALRTHTGHVLMTAHFLLTGYAFAWVVCGPDPGPARPPYPLRLVLLIATFGFHAFFGIAMMESTQPLAQEWFGALERDWGPTVAEDQYRGGSFAWAFGDYPIALLAAAMIVAWIRSDDRDARRFDRQADRDGDAALHAYNERLRRLADTAAAEGEFGRR